MTSIGQRAVLFIDNGGFNIKAMYLPPSFKTPVFLTVPNCVGANAHVGRGIIGEQMHQLPQYHGFLVRRPVDRGFIVDINLQVRVWEYVLQYFGIANEQDTDLWLTTPFGAPKAVASVLHHLLTVKFHFRAVTFVSSSFLVLLCYESTAHRWAESHINTSDMHGKTRKRTRGGNVMKSGCGVLVDLGFSHTTLVPYIGYNPVYSSIIRIDIGGKLLTNRLKEHISFTQTNLTEDSWLVNHIKERCCRVAMHPREELKQCCETAGTSRVKVGSGLEGKAQSSAVVYYLPAVPALHPLGCLSTELPKSFIQTQSQEKECDESTHLPSLCLNQECFLIPELLFTPSDVGLDQMGLVQALTSAIPRRGMLEQMQMMTDVVMSNIYVFGGVSQCPNLVERLRREVQEILPDSIVPCPTLICSTLLEKSTLKREKENASLLPLCGAKIILVGNDVNMRKWRKMARRRATIVISGHKRITESDIYEKLQNIA
ncbi:unnamed protein product [Phytomonas sp. Hart1]|nr:unnamed protein product [Phytomonas sp. Hart1]|eukprot:CCW71828.1 unnamed protein product [Phytomonas sp. isolate Hart1]